MTEYQKNKIKNKEIGKYIDYYSPRIKGILRLLGTRKKEDKNITIEKTIKSLRCKIIDVYFAEKLIGNYVHFGYRLVLEILRQNKNPFIFYGVFHTVEKLKLD
jgi:hypothetical protein